MKTTTKLTLRAAAVVVLATALSPLALGQSSEIEKAKRAEMERRAGEEERRISAWELRAAEVKRPPERRRDAHLAATQIREDYKQIQIVNNDLALLVSKKDALDFKYVAKSLSEIRTRAARLRENLVLPEAKKTSEQPKQEVGSEVELKRALTSLDKLIIEFVDNPIFVEPTIVNVPMSIKARRDLEEIIEMSDQIKKSTEKLKKAAQHTQ